DVAGILAVTMSDRDAVAWLRREAVHDVDWGGDPYNKAIARREGDTVRLSPRKSFERWRETVRGSSLPWTEEQAETARILRGHMVASGYLRSRRDARAAETLQRSALPDRLPDVAGWTVQASYSPSGGGRVGGDWYDAFMLPDGRLAVTVGDVAGHGMPAASTMGQLRNALRALLLREAAPAAAVADLDVFLRVTMPDQMATLLVGLLDPVTGELEYVRAGHFPPLVLHPRTGPTWPEDVRTLPLGYLSGRPGSGRLTVPPGGGVLLFTDGLVERRGTSLREGLERLETACARQDLDLASVVDAVRDPASADDATTVLLRRAAPGDAAPEPLEVAR
ncbi:SpoIIE family protein phosphatase, partial [Georgenia sp. 10Sc9-8]|nr:SpoIIE family protein phosphatase [Georgenia halotolerans]